MAQGSQSTGTQTKESAHARPRAAHGGKVVHHGRTPAAWAGVALAMVGVLLGGFALVDNQNWILFGIGAALCVLALIVARVLQVLGYGAN